MLPLSRGLAVAFLVGCLIAAVAVAGEPEGSVTSCGGPYANRKPTPEEIATVLRNHQAWLGSDRKRDDERRANLCQAHLDQANLQEARLVQANLQEAVLSRANLQKADLSGANLQKADLPGANLQKADLPGANLQEAHLIMADLQEADLSEANLQEAHLWGAHLRGAIYGPNPGKLPNFWTLTEPENKLETLVFHRSPAALIALREAFKKAGMRTQERQLTYAIEHTKQLQAWNPSWFDLEETDTRPWLEKLAGKSESLFSYVLFELPSHYGMAPGRALWGLLSFIPGFALLYWIALQHASSRSGLWMIVPADRLTRGRGQEKVLRIRPQTAKTWRERLMGEFRLFRTSLYFSLLSAFHLGWREFNVGTWIARMQPREYTLRATGWVRTVSGIQSLLSVYLLALWVLTYFGRPFE
jgi:uncharacterized protein YjbI with pentapeptide repeats